MVSECGLHISPPPTRPRFAGDAVTVGIKLRAIAGLADTDRCRAGGSGCRATRIIDKLLAGAALVMPLCFNFAEVRR